MKNAPDLFILSEHNDLLNKLRLWDIAYHQNDAPIVDDATYDAAKKRALEIEEIYPELAKNGASTHVGAAVSEKFKSFPHVVPMLSISDVFNEGEVADWFNKLSSKNIFIELKVDGVSYAARYENGVLVRGLTRGSGKNHMIRAALESIAYQTNDILIAMQKAIGSPLGVLKADGGASRNPFLMQFQADISHIPVERFEKTEATALGAAFLAGLYTGFWKNREELSSLCEKSAIFTPCMTEEARAKNLKGWQKAVRAAIFLSDPET